MAKNVKKVIPFEFVLEELFEVSPYIKPMFGAYAVYVKEKIVFILREKPEHREDNGVWLATTFEHHLELQNIFPNMRSIKIFGPGPSGWQILPSEAIDFEESVIRVCQMVLNKDPKIGKIPKSKLTSKKKKIAKIEPAIQKKKLMKKNTPVQKKKIAKKIKSIKKNHSKKIEV